VPPRARLFALEAPRWTSGLPPLLAFVPCVAGIIGDDVACIFRCLESNFTPANRLMLMWTVIGTLASVIGLGVGLYVMVVARGAREAAQAARALARKRNLTEELESASQRIQQVGNFIQQEQWVAVRMRTEEILASCKLTLTRWPDNLSEERRNEVMNASTLLRSIVMTTAEFVDGQTTPQQKKKITDAHIRASGHIHSALGEALMEEERDGDVNDGD
jgi:hypothetical protein